MTKKAAIFYQETGEEGIILFDKDETLEQLLERAPEEWQFRYVEDPVKDSDYYMDLYRNMEDWEIADMQEREDMERYGYGF